MPGEDWESADEARDAVRSDFPIVSYPGSFVALLSISSKTVASLLKLEGVQEQIDANEINAAVTMVEGELPSAICFKDSQALGFYRNSPNLRSVTYDQSIGKRIGLHIDSWEGGNISDKRYKRSRLLVNLGRSSRYLVFMTTPVDVLKNRLKIEVGPGYFVDQCFIMTKQMKKTVFSIKIRPGEAYIAPTECLVHDGSTRGGRFVDICFTIRSYFTLRTGAKPSY